MNRFNQFLNLAARQMRAMPAALRDDELRELRGHIEQRAEDYRSAGMSDDEAQKRALEGLGSPRRLGAQLCDAWEGIAWSWWRLIASIVVVTTFLMFAGLTLVFALTIVPMNSEIALFTEIIPLLCGIFVALPLFCGALFSRCVGRRGCIVAPLYFLALAWGNLTVNFPGPSQAFAMPPANFMALINADWFNYFWVVLAWIGAWMDCSRRLQLRTLATVDARGIEPKKALWMRLNLKLWRGCLLLAIIASALYPLRIWLQLHPRTPDATLRNYLVLNRQMNGGDFESPKILATNNLPPKSPAEIAGRQQRIQFAIEACMTPQYAARRVAYLKNLLNEPEMERPFEDKTLRNSLARLQRNREIVRGVATLIQTSAGWEVEKQNAPIMGDWAYDLAYQR